MCGLNGILRLSPDAPAIDSAELRRTRDAMASRGPDGAGEWFAGDGTVALGHRRLAIIDLSERGAQPMASADGRLHIVYNGEIYNHRDLRADLERHGVGFRSTSDTEVLLALYDRHHDDMLRHLRGMYAFALWDGRSRRLLLARDPYGIKPLYWSCDGRTLRFASQVKALEAGRAVSQEVDPVGLAGFLLWGSVPEPHTIRRDIHALPAGHVLVVEDGRIHNPAPPVGTEPLSLRSPEGAEAISPHEHSVSAAIAESITAHLVADVPVAVFLSAGLDSAMIAAVAARALPEPPTTLTVRFDELLDTPFDEGPLAAETARSLGTRHLERTVSRRDFLDLWPRAVAAMDQPSIDGFNTFVIAEAAAAEGFRVVLSGLGGDELFGSYPSFRDVPRWTRLARWGLPLAPLWPAIARLAAPRRPKLRALLRIGGSLPGAYFLRRGLFLPGELPALVGRDLAEAGLTDHDPVAAVASLAADAEPWLAVHRMETGQYMRNQLLRDADWAAMAHSLELRVPFVDPWLHAAVAGAGFEPARSHGKVALARQTAPGLPAVLFDRPKSGFTIPVMRWLDPDGCGRPTTLGLDSRNLALRVLREWGIEVTVERAA